MFQRRASGNNAAAVMSKPAWSWNGASEEAALGALLLRLAEPARILCAAEPRLLRLASPVIAVGESARGSARSIVETGVRRERTVLRFSLKEYAEVTPFFFFE